MKENKDIEKIRRDMMELWKETFQDSNRYIELIFDTYFCRENVFVRYDGDLLIASMLCVPYEFQFISGKINEKLKGMYLCGLATRPEYRKQGIMKELMFEAEKSIKTRGYDMTFLIPADDHLREYYRIMGYYDGSYRTIKTKNLLSKEQFQNLYIYTFKDLAESGNFELVKEFAGWCHERELKIQEYSTIIHSEKDLITAIAENENSIFLSDRPIDLKYPILTNVIAVVFPEIFGDNQRKCLRIVEMYLQDVEAGEEHHQNLSEQQLDNISNVICNYFGSTNIEFVFSNNIYKETDPIRNYPYAMIKPIGNNPIFANKMKPTFRISLMLD